MHLASQSFAIMYSNSSTPAVLFGAFRVPYTRPEGWTSAEGWRALAWLSSSFSPGKKPLNNLWLYIRLESAMLDYARIQSCMVIPSVYVQEI